jgi:endonuclease NucS-like protein/EVE domain-containing protein
MDYWIFTVAPHNGDSESYTAREIYERRMRDRFWGLGTQTANRKGVHKGDRVVFYLARPEQVFVGTARLASDSFDLSANEQSGLSHGSAFFTAEHGVRLEEIETWERAHPMAPLARTLKFIKNRAQWWTHLQGGIRPVEESDFEAITSGAAPAQRVQGVVEDLESQGLFALEAHLEDFIARNWSKVPWGAALELYQDGEQTGQQFPAGTWSIDFLAVDRKKNEFVVIELKRGQTSDATVGQVLRYVNWVTENVANENQKVRGIIVASEIDDALKYAARGLPNVSVMSYKVAFSLQQENL